MTKNLKNLYFLAIFFFFAFFNFPSEGYGQSSDKRSVTPLVFEGRFESKRGVLTSLSCYCNNGGYVMTDSGAQVAVCFENTDERITCKIIRVEGVMSTKRIDPEPTNACKAGEMEYLKVLSYECKQS